MIIHFTESPTTTEPQTVRVQVLSPEAHLPEKAHATDACFDLTAASRTYDRVLNVTIYGTGLAFELPADHVMHVYPRSSVYKYATTMANSVAVIDPGYRGELHVILTGNAPYRVGERIAQCDIRPIIPTHFVKVDTLSTDTDRGTNGLGSTGL